MCVSVLGGCALRGKGNKADTTTIRIDAAKGAVDTEVHEFPTRGKVAVEIVNANPFVHQYRLRGSQTTYTEGAISEFAKLLGFASITAPPAPTVTNLAGAQWSSQWFFDRSLGTRASPGTAQCFGVEPPVANTANALALTLAEQRRIVADRGGKVRDGVSALAARVAATGAQVDQASGSLVDHRLTSNVLTQKITVALELAEPYSRELGERRAQLADSLTAYITSVVDFGKRAREQWDRYPSCAGFAAMVGDAGRWAADTAIYRGALSRIAQHDTAVRAIIASLTKVRSSPEAMTVRYSFGPFADPHTVDVLVQRSLVGQDTVWRTIANPRLMFGPRRRFAIGIGGMVHKVASATYGTRLRFRREAAEQPEDTTSERVVVQTEAIERQVVPMATLTMRAIPLPFVLLDGIHLFTGVASRSPGGSLTFDYVLGAALSGADERIMLGLGVVSAEQQRLADGVVLNQRLPASQTDAPIRKVRVGKPALVLVFRLF